MFKVLGAVMCQQSWFVRVPRESFTYSNENMIAKSYHFVESNYFNDIFSSRTDS